MEKTVGVAQLYFMPHPLLEIVQRLMAHPVCTVLKNQACNFYKYRIYNRKLRVEVAPTLGT